MSAAKGACRFGCAPENKVKRSPSQCHVAQSAGKRSGIGSSKSALAISMPTAFHERKAIEHEGI
jgi:hypothetical protein